MDAATRKQKLIELMENDNNIAMTGIPLQYKGETRIEKVYRIPLDYLIYNKYNGRIGSDVLSYEKQNGALNPKFMYHDKLCFIDVMVKKLHGNKDADDAVMDAMKDYMEYEVKEYGNIPDKEDYLDIGFMEHCYNLGQRSMELYSHQWKEQQRKHDDDKIMKVLCRAIKAVMDYEWGKDGVNG